MAFSIKLRRREFCHSFLNERDQAQAGHTRELKSVQALYQLAGEVVRKRIQLLYDCRTKSIDLVSWF